MSVASKFRTTVSSKKDAKMKTEAGQDVAYPTGFITFDFMNGSRIVHYRQDGEKVLYNNIGITEGSIVLTIGRSGCGKTTLVMQMAGNICRKFDSSCIFHEDIEGGISTNRKILLSGMSEEEFEERYIARNGGVNAENFYERIKLIHDIKTGEEYDENLYDTGIRDRLNRPIMKLTPTVVILDSLALLMPKNYTEEEQLSGQMSATAAAKANASVFKRIVPMLKAANIILFIINHITDKVEINAFSHTPSLISYLKPNETLPGGRTPVYLANLILRIDDSTKLKETEGFKILGSKVTLTILKSRTAAPSSSVELIFDYSRGFDPDLSLFEYLKSNGYVNGAGVGMYFGERSDMKFSQAKFKEKLETNPEFRQVFIETAKAAMDELMERKEQNIIVQERASTSSISSDILAQMNEGIGFGLAA